MAPLGTDAHCCASAAVALHATSNDPPQTRRKAARKAQMFMMSSIDGSGRTDPCVCTRRNAGCFATQAALSLDRIATVLATLDWAREDEHADRSTRSAYRRRPRQ